MSSKKGTWPQAIGTFLLPILLIMVVRWSVVEPFVIPSGSMIPSLLIHDHILVKKFDFGLKWPFTKSWIWFWNRPQRGDVVVFRYPENEQVFYVKRLVGLPGDEVVVAGRSLWINGELIAKESSVAPSFVAAGKSVKGSGQEDFSNDDTQIENYDYFMEQLGQHRHSIRFQKNAFSDEAVKKTYVVPEGEYFMMGDNRDESSDSRVWGFVPEAYLVGTPAFILMGCSESLPNSSFCSPRHLTFSRIFKRVL